MSVVARRLQGNGDWWSSGASTPSFKFVQLCIRVGLLGTARVRALLLIDLAPPFYSFNSCSIEAVNFLLTRLISFLSDSSGKLHVGRGRSWNEECAGGDSALGGCEEVGR